jgi:biotin carboxyl carrier protein
MKGLFEAALELDPESSLAIQGMSLAQTAGVRLTEQSPRGTNTADVVSIVDVALLNETSARRPTTLAVLVTRSVVWGLVPAVSVALVLGAYEIYFRRPTAGQETPAAGKTAEPSQAPATAESAGAPITTPGPAPSQPTPTPAPLPVPPIPAAVMSAGRLALTVERVWHNVLVDITARTSGTIERRCFGKSEPVRRGARLFTITGGATGETEEERALAAKVAELTKLAAEDAVYQEFLRRAQQDLESKRRGKTGSAIVTSPVAGLAQSLLENGAPVEVGQTLGRIVDARRWLLTARVPAGARLKAPLTCVVRSASLAKEARCRVEDPNTKGDTEIVRAAVPTQAAPWLADAGELTLILSSAPR